MCRYLVVHTLDKFYFMMFLVLLKLFFGGYENNITIYTDTICIYILYTYNTYRKRWRYGVILYLIDCIYYSIIYVSAIILSCIIWHRNNVLFVNIIVPTVNARVFSYKRALIIYGLPHKYTVIYQCDVLYVRRYRTCEFVIIWLVLTVSHDSIIYIIN